MVLSSNVGNDAGNGAGGFDTVGRGTTSSTWHWEVAARRNCPVRLLNLDLVEYWVDQDASM